MPMALCLNDPPLIRAVWLATPTELIELVARATPLPYLPRLLGFLGAELEASRHLHAILLWVHQILVWHGAHVRAERSIYELPLRTLHKGVCTRYDELAKLCHGNQFALDVLSDQLAHAATAATAADGGA